MKGKDLSNANDYKRPEAEEIKDDFKFMQIDVDYYTISKQNLNDLQSKYKFSNFYGYKLFLLFLNHVFA